MSKYINKMQNRLILHVKIYNKAQKFEQISQWCPKKVSDASLNSLIKLVADIAKRNNLGTLVKGKNLTWHSIYSNTACPGAYLLSKMDYIATEAN